MIIRFLGTLTRTANRKSWLVLERAAHEVPDRKLPKIAIRRRTYFTKKQFLRLAWPSSTPDASSPETITVELCQEQMVVDSEAATTGLSLEWAVVQDDSSTGPGTAVHWQPPVQRP